MKDLDNTEEFGRPGQAQPPPGNTGRRLPLTCKWTLWGHHASSTLRKLCMARRKNYEINGAWLNTLVTPHTSPLGRGTPPGAASRTRHSRGDKTRQQTHKKCPEERAGPPPAPQNSNLARLTTCSSRRWRPWGWNWWACGGCTAAARGVRWVWRPGGGIWPLHEVKTQGRARVAAAWRRRVYLPRPTDCRGPRGQNFLG